MTTVEHEEIVFRHDRNSGLRAIIVIHNTAIGPAMGGVRHWVYGSSGQALRDAVRLAEGMTYKNALADIPFGGGKSVILGRSGHSLSAAELGVFGEWIDALGGRYITAEDVGMKVVDMRMISRRTPFVSGLGRNGFGGDPSPATAKGVYLGICSAVRVHLGARSLCGIRVAVQGLGNVGRALCGLLHDAGVELVVADLNQTLVRSVCAEFDARAVSCEEIVNQEVDVFAPCALGGVLSSESVARLRAVVVAGSANNQLTEPEIADLLVDRGILYAPDYVINAGGVISVAHEYLGNNDPGWVDGRIAAIPLRLERIFSQASKRGENTEVVASAMARAAIAASSDALSEHSAGQGQ